MKEDITNYNLNNHIYPKPPSLRISDYDEIKQTFENKLHNQMKMNYLHPYHDTLHFDNINSLKNLLL